MVPRKIAEASLPTEYGDFRVIGFEGPAADGASPERLLALIMGVPDTEIPTLVRIHSQCLTGDTFGSSRCDCGQQLNVALERIAAAGQGILIYQLAEGRGIGLMNKLLAYELQDRGKHDTVEANHQLGFAADERSYAFPAAVLRLLGVRRMRVMSNNPLKIAALEDAGFAGVERVSIEIPPSKTSENYLRTKKDKLGHLLSGV
jgi:3,4-dihydroxy 2-butanone 4-phosphate synthase/GTP cyclohydrolase II